VDGRQVIASADVNENFRTALLQEDGKIVLVAYSWVMHHGVKAVLTRYYGGIQQTLVANLRQNGNVISINWQGLDDKGITFYSIQYSQTTARFREKGKRSGIGSSHMREYSYPAGAAGFYRIVAVGKTGSKTFSNILRVNETDLTAAATIFPNPVKDYLNVQGLNRYEQLTFSIVDGTGAVLSSGVSRGSTQYRAVVSHLPSGTYYLRISGKRKTTTLKFVKA
jgi:hypothetical protein